MVKNDSQPLHGYAAGASPIPLVETLSDAELQELNEILPWKAFVADSSGRRFGSRASLTKRFLAEPVPDPRIVTLHERVDLTGLTVFEVGCFEGIHTVALAQRAARVKACDSRIGNVVKTAVRCAMFQVRPTLFVWNVEQQPPVGQDLDCDVLHHVGVFYHLLDPVAHMTRIAPFVRRAIMLDTHYSEPNKATETFFFGGRNYRYQPFRESGLGDVFSGMYETSRWLLLPDIVELLRGVGFTKVDVISDYAPRYGPRCTIIAER
jgi:hypothetical protein